jgi:hypothetical protein
VKYQRLLRSDAEAPQSPGPRNFGHIAPRRLKASV